LGEQILDSSRELAAIAAIMNLFMVQMRQECLQQIVVATVNLIKEMGFHLSDYLTALASYVQTKSSVDPDTELTRSVVASLLETAAIEAETKGRELP
jgi:phosphotransacetylase